MSAPTQSCFISPCFLSHHKQLIIIIILSCMKRIIIKRRQNKCKSFEAIPCMLFDGAEYREETGGWENRNATNHENGLNVR